MITLAANTDIYIPEELMQKKDQMINLSGNFLRDFGKLKPQAEGYDHFYIIGRTRVEDCWKCLRVNNPKRP
jgi:hypothetical protein